MATMLTALKTGLFDGGQDTLILALLSCLTVWPLWRGLFSNQKIARMKYATLIPILCSVAFFLVGAGVLGGSALATRQQSQQLQAVQSTQTFSPTP